jgi:hypothetical protein
MEHGDLTLVNRPTIIVVLEGVLANVDYTTTGRLPWSKTTTHQIVWLNTPIKRLATMIRSFDVDIDVITFTDQDVADEAAEFFNDIGLHVSTVQYQPFDRWAQTLPFMVVQQVIDSDQERLDRYGQLGRSVIQGEDF